MLLNLSRRYAFFWSRFGEAGTGLRRWHSVLMVLSLSVAAAHGVSYNDLGTLTLCLDSSTFQVTIESNDPTLDALHKSMVEERLRAALSKALTDYRVPFNEKASCEGEVGFVYAFFYARWLYPADEEPSVLAAAGLQVGGFTVVEADPEFVLPDERFDAYTSGQILESDLDKPFYQILPTVNEEMMAELATAWWNDRGYQEDLRRASQRALLVRLSVLSGGITLLILVGGLYVWRRRRRLLST